jgi:argonaute-like protein implicated in RNA metabolism and viral defense
MNAPQSIAKWMLEELEREKYLYQEVVVYEIQSKFGEEFTYINENGNWAIDKRVLREFRNLTENTVVWKRGERYWRFREDYDDPNKRQAE